MLHGHDLKAASLLSLGDARGLTLIPASSPLTRLHFFDGKLLRAEHLELEQRYVRQLAALANQAGGSGVVHGFDCTLAGGDRLEIGAGLAIDPAGRALLLPDEAAVSLAELIEASRRREEARRVRARSQLGAGFQHCDPRADEPAGQQEVEGTTLYVITLSHAEAFCGQEDVYGKLCESACITSTDRPYITEGVVVRALPLILRTPFPASAAFPLTRLHLRSRVASAYFEDERHRVASLISGEGLASEVWCLGAQPAGGSDVPIAVVARAGGTTVYLDAWTVRRERMETPPQRYWAWRMAMRPWNAFLAQVLQFQCQLRDGLSGGEVDPDPCADAHGLLEEADRRLGSLLEFYGQVAGRLANLDVGEPADLKEIRALRERLSAPRAKALAGTDRILLRRGIVELPSAGYLPVVPGSRLTVNQQVQRLLGPGVDLRFCIVRPDFVPHALEEAQHMERISLLQGLDDPRNRPEVDILVPDGKIAGGRLAEGLGYRALVTMLSDAKPKYVLGGVARAEALSTGGGALYFAGAAKITNPTLAGVAAQMWADLRCTANPFFLPVGDSTSASLRAVLSEGTTTSDFRLQGDLRIEATTGGRRISGTLSGHQVSFTSKPGVPKESDVEIQQIGFQVQLEGDAVAGELKIVAVSARNKNNSMEALVAWKDSPQRVEGELLNREDGESEPMLRTSLLEDGDVLKVGGLAHEAALETLKALGQAIEEKGFADASARLLFATPPAGGGLELTATRDWVLFHRRRTKTCADVAEGPTPAPARRYKVFHLKETPDFLNQIIEALKNDRPLRAQLTEVADVEFSGGLATLRTSAADFVSAWEAAGPGPGLYAGLIASQSKADDGATLAANRLDHLRGTFSGKPPDAPGAPGLEVLAGFPSSLPIGDADGAIVLLTVENVAIETVCHTIYRAPSISMLKRLQEMAERGEMTQNNLAQFSVQLLGNTDFVAGEAKLIEGSETDVVTEWQVNGGVPRGILVVTAPADSESLDLRQKQALELIELLGGSLGEIHFNEVVKSPIALPSDCPASVFLAVD